MLFVRAAWCCAVCAGILCALALCVRWHSVCAGAVGRLKSGKVYTAYFCNSILEPDCSIIGITKEATVELNLFSAHGSFLWRYLHIFFGIIWIGHLYYFNFVQTPFFAETDNNTKSGAIQKLVPRALWWFRWGAMFTFVTGLLLLGVGAVNGYSSAAAEMGSGESSLGAHVWANLTTQWGVFILPGALLGTLMFLNVWLIIWPNQKIVIASTTAVASGGQADPRAAGSAARAGVASRTNALFSIPMLFFMVATGHLTLVYGSIGEESRVSLFWILFGLVTVALEANAIWGKLNWPLKTVKNVVLSGFALTVILYCLLEYLIIVPAAL